MLGMFEAGLFPGVNYYLSWYVALLPSCRFISYFSDRPSPKLAGTNAPSLVSAQPSSSQLPPSPAHSVVCSQ